MNGVILTSDPELDCTKPSDKWVKMSHQDRCDCLSKTIDMRTTGVQFLRLDKTTHVTAQIVGHSKKYWPVILRDLETLLKREVESSLQVYLEPRQDDSLLRLGRLNKK